MPGKSSLTDVLALRIPKVLSLRIDSLAKAGGVTPKAWVIANLARAAGFNLANGSIRSHHKKGVSHGKEKGEAAGYDSTGIS